MILSIPELFFRILTATIFRIRRLKVISTTASIITIAGLVLVAIRWRGPIPIWESLYIFPAAIGVGLLNSSQFVALSIAVEKSQLATSIGMFFLSQQLGMMFGASVSAVVLTSVFRKGLMKTVGSDERSVHVGIVEKPNIMSHC